MSLYNVCISLMQSAAGSCDADPCKLGDVQECSGDEGCGNLDGDGDDDDVWATMEAVGDTVSSKPAIKKSKEG